jgi:arylsulfatase A-like enzyme
MKINKQAALAEMLIEMDKGVGEILTTIENCGIADRTLVVFFSDNGPAGGSAGPLRGRKGSNYEGGHRVPAVAWWPSRIKAGQQTDALAISLDVMPTLLSIAGYSDSSGLALDGKDLSPVLFDNESEPGRQLFWNERAMRDGNWKLVLNKPNSEAAQLFDLSQDLGEKVNLANRYPERVEQMRTALADWKRDVATAATEQPVKH